MSDKIISIGNQIIKMGGGMLGYNDVFTPYDISNMIAWYDSKDLSTISKDENNYVSQWNDKSSNIYHLTQATALNQPLYSVSDGLVFNGTSSYMSKIFGVTYNQPITIFIIYTNNSTGQNGAKFALSGRVTQNTNYCEIANTSIGTYIRMNAGSNVEVYSRSINFTDLIFSYIYNGASSQLFENNVLKSGIINPNTKGVSEIALGYSPFVADSSTFLKGNIKEVIIYNNICTAVEITLINNYLKLKYNL